MTLKLILSLVIRMVQELKWDSYAQNSKLFIIAIGKIIRNHVPPIFKNTWIFWIIRAIKVSVSFTWRCWVSVLKPIYFSKCNWPMFKVWTSNIHFKYDSLLILKRTVTSGSMPIARLTLWIQCRFLILLNSEGMLYRKNYTV